MTKHNLKIIIEFILSNNHITQVKNKLPPNNWFHHLQQQ
uniref:Uncharacterized protein n=1 Tax=Anguilla anguilla TaxID=7936 RepID=A0A0E9PA53_ANGAN